MHFDLVFLAHDTLRVRGYLDSLVVIIVHQPFKLVRVARMHDQLEYFNRTVSCPT